MVTLMVDDDEKISSILSESRVIAVVGASPKPGRPSNRVCRYLLQQGFDVIPVRPRIAVSRLSTRN